MRHPLQTLSLLEFGAWVNAKEAAGSGLIQKEMRKRVAESDSDGDGEAGWAASSVLLICF